MKNQLHPSGSSKPPNYKIFEEEKSSDHIPGLKTLKSSDLQLDEIRLDYEDGLKGADSDPTVHLNQEEGGQQEVMKPLIQKVRLTQLLNVDCF